MHCEIGQACQIVNGHEVVDVRKRGLDPARQRFVVGRSEERIEPDQAGGGMHFPSTIQISDAEGESIANYVNQNSMTLLRDRE
jgi:hypothetical protein